MKNRTSDSLYNFSKVWDKINEIDERVKKLEKLEKHVPKIKEIQVLKGNRDITDNSNSQELTSVISINVPEETIDQIERLDERIKFPILWHYSSKPIMTVEEFLNACSDKGFSLSPSWLPSAGGNFKNRLVKEDKMFREADKLGKNKTYTLTDIGKLKIKRELQKIKPTK